MATMIKISTDYDFDTLKEIIKLNGNRTCMRDVGEYILDSLCVEDGKIKTCNGDKKIKSIAVPYSEQIENVCKERGWKYKITAEEKLMFSCDDCEHYKDGACEYGYSMDECEDAYDCPRFEDKGD